MQWKKVKTYDEYAVNFATFSNEFAEPQLAEQIETVSKTSDNMWWLRWYDCIIVTRILVGLSIDFSINGIRTGA